MNNPDLDRLLEKIIVTNTTGSPIKLTVKFPSLENSEIFELDAGGYISLRDENAYTRFQSILKGDKI